MKLSPRSLKLASVIEQKLPTIIHRFLTPEDVGFLTITAVEVSGDLAVADVFVRSLNGPAAYLKKLNRSASKLSAELLKHLEVRQAIKLRFKPDKSVEHVEKMEEFL